MPTEDQGIWDGMPNPAGAARVALDVPASAGVVAIPADTSTTAASVILIRVPIPSPLVRAAARLVRPVVNLLPRPSSGRSRRCRCAPRLHAVSVRSLSRFVEAQDRGGAYETAVAELRAGQKRSHWMWFVFPQLAGLGSSEMATTYGVTSLSEARTYLADATLAARLRTAAELVLAHADHPMTTLLGPVDAMKLRSSMTLFHLAAPNDEIFSAVLDRCFGGERDERTLGLIGEPP